MTTIVFVSRPFKTTLSVVEQLFMWNKFSNVLTLINLLLSHSGIVKSQASSKIESQKVLSQRFNDFSRSSSCAEDSCDDVWLLAFGFCRSGDYSTDCSLFIHLFLRP